MTAQGQNSRAACLGHAWCLQEIDERMPSGSMDAGHISGLHVRSMANDLPAALEGEQHIEV